MMELIEESRQRREGVLIVLRVRDEAMVPSITETIAELR